MNPFENIFKTLDKGGLILYPTETVWGLGCDANKEEAIYRIYSLKKRPFNKPLIALVSSIEMLQLYTGKLDKSITQSIENSSEPLTIIYPKVRSIAHNACGEDGSMALRIPKNKILTHFIDLFGKALISTSANRSGMPFTHDFKEIDSNILEGVDDVVNLPINSMAGQPSKVVKLMPDRSLKTLRF